MTVTFRKRRNGFMERVWLGVKFRVSKGYYKNLIALDVRGIYAPTNPILNPIPKRKMSGGKNIATGEGSREAGT